MNKFKKFDELFAKWQSELPELKATGYTISYEMLECRYCGAKDTGYYRFAIVYNPGSPVPWINTEGTVCSECSEFVYNYLSKSKLPTLLVEPVWKDSTEPCNCCGKRAIACIDGNDSLTSLPWYEPSYSCEKEECYSFLELKEI